MWKITILISWSPLNSDQTPGVRQPSQGASGRTRHQGTPLPHNMAPTHIELDDPQEGDEEQVKGDKETEGAADVRDGLAFLQRWWDEV